MLIMFDLFCFLLVVLLFSLEFIEGVSQFSVKGDKESKLKCKFRWVQCIKKVNPLHPNISIQILHTFLYKFSLVLARRICLAIKVSKVGNHFLYSHERNK